MLRKRIDASIDAAAAVSTPSTRSDIAELTAADSLYERRAPLSQVLAPDTYALLRFHVCLVLELASRIPPSCKLVPDQVGAVLRSHGDVTDRILNRLNGASVSPEGAARAAAIVALREATFLYETTDRLTVDGLRRDKDALLGQLAECEATISSLNKELASMQKAQISIQAVSHRKFVDERERLVASQAECQRQSVEIRRLNERVNGLRGEVEELQQQRDDDRSWWQLNGAGDGGPGDGAPPRSTRPLQLAGSMSVRPATAPNPRPRGATLTGGPPKPAVRKVGAESPLQEAAGETDSPKGMGMDARKVSIVVPLHEVSPTKGAAKRPQRAAWGASSDDDTESPSAPTPSNGPNLNTTDSLFSTYRTLNLTTPKISLPTTSLRQARAGAPPGIDRSVSPQHGRPKTADSTSQRRATGWRTLVSSQRMKEAYLTLGGTEDGRFPLDRNMVREFLAESFEDFGDPQRWDRIMKPYPRIAYDEFCMIVLRLVKQ